MKKKYVDSVHASLSTTDVPTEHIPTEALFAILEAENTELRNSAVELALEIQELRTRFKESVKSLRDIRSGGFYH